MTRTTTLDDGRDLDCLFAEIRVYLGVVDALRREGIEPRWAGKRRSPSRDRRASCDRDRPFPKLVWVC